MDFDHSSIETVRQETKAELLRWKAQWKPSSSQHIAANAERVRRDDEVKSWFWMGIAIVAVSIVVGFIWF